MKLLHINLKKQFLFNYYKMNKKNKLYLRKYHIYN